MLKMPQAKVTLLTIILVVIFLGAVYAHATFLQPPSTPPTPTPTITPTKTDQPTQEKQPPKESEVYGDEDKQVVINYDDVLVVVNINSNISMDVGQYFASQRGIPNINLAHISAPTTEEIPFTEFNETVRKPVERHLIENNLTDSINYIVTTKGVPLKVRGEGIKARSASVDSELALILGADQSEIGNAGSIRNHYFAEKEHFSHIKHSQLKGHPSYLVTRLTGYNFTDIKNLIDNAALAVGTAPDGVFIIDVDPEHGYKPQGVGLGNRWMQSAYQLLKGRDFTVNFDNTTTFILNQKGVMGYVSWGSNDHNCTLPSDQWNHTFKPGAIAELYVSTSAYTFTTGSTYWQSLIADLIHDGVTGVKGYVNEPYLESVAHPNILFDRYTTGFNLAESYYMASLQCLSWQDCIIGDPKTSPYQDVETK